MMRGPAVPLRSTIVAPLVVGGRGSGPGPDRGQRRLDSGRLRPRGLVAPGRREALVPAMESQLDVTAFAVPALQVPQRYGVALVAVRGQDEGVIGPKLQLRAFAEGSQVQP